MSNGNPNQPKIRGYRKIADEDVALVNIAKGKADDVDSFVCALENRDHTPSRSFGELEAARIEPADGSVDPRELALARTKLQEGFMHLVRAIAQPRSF